MGWNGEKLGKGNYVLSRSGTRKIFKLTTTLANGKSLTTTVGWKVNSPLNNRLSVDVEVDPSNSYSINLTWRMNKLPDLDLSTPEDAEFGLALTGDSNFTSGALATHSPIETEVKLTFDVDKADLNGKLKKVMAGKEYSIEFQPGLAIPMIKMGA